MWFGFYILGVFLWILIALWPARVAAQKGHSFWGYFLVSIFFWWITLFVVYFGLQDNNLAASPKPAE
jgi:1-acyl-sn-glycerol-3-phosphate acyltransferase